MVLDFILPNATVVEHSLSMLYSDIDVKEVSREANGEANKVYGVLVNAENKPVAVSMCDIEFAAFAGSALMMLPPAAAEEAVETGELTSMMTENVYEVFNISSRLYMSDETPHLKLEKMYVDYTALPADVKEVVDTAKGNIVVSVDFPRYGKGTISFVTT